MAFLRNKKCKGNDYYVMVENRRVDGKVKQYTLETIGTWDKVMERFSSFWNQEHSQHVAATFEAFIHGAPYALYQIAEQLKIEAVLDKIFPGQQRNGVKRSTSLILAAIHRACAPGSKNAFSDWFKKTSLPYHLKIDPDSMTSQHFWDQMDGLTQEQLELAEDTITEIITSLFPDDLDFLSLDYTNYYTFIDSNNARNDICRRGHNKQKRNDLRQFSLAVITTKASGIPLVTHLYKGNRNDQTEFPIFVEMIQNRFKFYDPDKMTLIFDGGSNTKDNLNCLEPHFICSFSLSNAKSLLDIDIASYYDISLKEKSVRGFMTDAVIWGITRRCILTESIVLRKGQTLELKQSIEKFKAEMEYLEEQIKNPKARIKKDADSLRKRAESFIKGKKHLKEFITVTAGDFQISYTIDEEARAQIEKKWFGKKLTITDHLDWREEEILEAYYSQECVEKVFRDTKDTNHFALKPVYHWTDQKIRVHVFVCLLSLMLGQILMKEMEKNGINISKDKMLDELNGIYDGWVIQSATGKKMSFTRVLGKMTKEQEKLWEVVSKLNLYAPHKET